MAWHSRNTLSGFFYCIGKIEDFEYAIKKETPLS